MTSDAMDMVFARNKVMSSEESVAYGRSFHPRPSDVFVVTYPKCGTTWVTQICHTLRSRGYEDFHDLDQVVPWDITALDLGQDLDSEQVGDIRVFKSHECYETVAKGGKYIYVSRDPRDVLASFYKFLPAFVNVNPADITIEEFARRLFIGEGSNSGKIWDHIVSWWTHRDDPNVLWLCFEDLKLDLEGGIRKIARFMGVPLDDELLAIAMDQASLKTMKANCTKYDMHLLIEAIKTKFWGIPKDVYFTADKVVSGKVGGGKTSLPADILSQLDAEWSRKVKDTTGLQSYDDLRDSVSTT